MEASMVWVLGLVPLVFLALLILGAVTGRVSVTSCCAVGDAARDLRMRPAFADEEESRSAPGPTVT